MNLPETTNINTRQQLLDALATFHEAHQAAESAAATWNDLKLMVGSNEQTRKEQQRSMPPETYASLTAECHEAEKVKTAAVAHLERVEKNLNVLRELLNHESAELARTTADALGMAATIADTTAQRYAVLTGTRTTFAEIRARYPSKPTNGDVAEEDLPF